MKKRLPYKTNEDNLRSNANAENYTSKNDENSDIIDLINNESENTTNESSHTSEFSSGRDTDCDCASTSLRAVPTLITQRPSFNPGPIWVGEDVPILFLLVNKTHLNGICKKKSQERNGTD